MKFATKTYLTSLQSLLFAVAVLIPLAASAQQTSAWRVNQEHSVARLSLGTATQSLEAGITRVGGTVVLDPVDPAVARLNFATLNDEPQHSQITFTSKRSWVRADGTLAIAGDLTVTRVVHIVQIDPNEGYSGAQYGEPIVYTNTSEATLVFPQVKSANGEDEAFQLSGSTTVDAEDFPLLRASLQSGDWSGVLVEDRQSATFATIGEDYAGFPSTGTAVVTATSSTVAGTGEGFYGFVPVSAPDTRKASIALDMKLTRAIASAPGVSAALGN